MRYLISTFSILLLVFTPTLSTSMTALDFKTSSMDELSMQRVYDFCSKADFRFDNPRDYFTAEDIIKRLLPLFPHTVLKSSDDNNDISVAADLYIESAETNATINIIFAKSAEKARNALLKDLVMCSASIDVLLSIYKAYFGIGDFCIRENTSTEAIKRFGETLYFARGNVGCRIRSFNGEIDIVGIARQIDSLLTATKTK